jgi:hypothetical protein
MWDLWWTYGHWGRISLNTSVSLAKQSTSCSTLIIIHHHHHMSRYNRPVVASVIVDSVPDQLKKKRE